MAISIIIMYRIKSENKGIKEKFSHIYGNFSNCKTL